MFWKEILWIFLENVQIPKIAAAAATAFSPMTGIIRNYTYFYGCRIKHISPGEFG
jgi:hypothetical protein